MNPIGSRIKGYKLSTYKIIIVGEGGVGKTSLCIRVTRNSFPADYRLTIGTGFFTYELNLKQLKRKISLQIWDFGGQKQFASILDAFTRDAKGAILAFDISSAKSFELLQKNWLPFLKRTVSEVPVLLISTKNDLSEEVSKEEIDQLLENERQSKSINIVKYLPTSAKIGKNVEQCFVEIAKAIFAQYR